MRIVINNQDYQNFTTYDLELNYSKIASVFSFSGLAETLPAQLSYPSVEIYRTNEEDGSEELLLTGEILSKSETLTAKPTLTPVTGYSKTGVLEDCDMPTTSVQFDNMTLREIVEQLINPFDLEYEVTANVQADFDKKYKKTTSEVNTKVKDFINSLTSQLNIILSHTNAGKLLFTRIEVESETPAYTFIEGEAGFTAMSLAISGQNMHNFIKVVRQASSDSPDASEASILNPYISKFRPKSKILTSGDTFSVDKAARMELNTELANIKITIESLIFVRPGKLVYISAPSLGINGYSVFLVETTSVKGTVSSETYTLNCVLADAYSDTSEIINIFES